ncbi:hypothetical protein DFH08DRAFT_879163 [Mycena albidolilacea]|uniref:F-box domain-containing protein n=1 Tax=Mycena albidolilacea TaxID=1033008 RepID=A0AAD6ZQQ8_9AGAR|nr:hypothetical protein DFH08DRAFT_879163 [Mycena albidolilacea]
MSDANVEDAGNEEDEDTESTNESVDPTSKLPNETLLVIFRHALPPSWVMGYASSLAPFPQKIWSADIQTKLCIMGVCKTWHRLGLEFLYENVMLRSLGQLAAFMRTLEARPELAALMRRLEICYPVLRGYTALHSTEADKIFELCPRLTHFVFNSHLIAGGHRAPAHPPAFPAIAGVCLALTNLDIGDNVEYPVVLPALVQLCQTLQSLSLPLPDNYGYSHPTLTFARLENLRIAVMSGSRVSAAYWVCPGLQQLVIRPCGSTATEVYHALARTFLAAYGATVVALTVCPLNVSWPESLPLPFQDLSAQCPALQCLGISEYAVNAEPPLCHSTVASLNIFRSGSRPGLPLDGEFERLQSRFPALRACRYVQNGAAFPPMTRGGPGGPDGVSSIVKDTPDEYDLPLGPWLTVLWSEEFPEDDESDDSNYVFTSEEEWCSEDGSEEHPDQCWEYYSDGERKHSPSSGATSEDEFDSELERDEALTIFEHILHGALPEEEDFDDNVERDGSDKSSGYFQ